MRDFIKNSFSKINNNLEQQAQAIFKSWFVDFEPFGGVMPDDWGIGSLAEIATVSNGKRPPNKSLEETSFYTIPLVGATSVMGYTSTYNHNNKILVIGRVGTNGVVQRYNSPCWTSDNTLVIESKYYEYIYQVLQIIDYSALNRGSTQPLITQADIKKEIILLPDIDTLKKYEAVVSILMYHTESNLNENKKLTHIRDTLLPKLMNGEIDVSNIKI